ncbi:hypothetical protein [Nocardioides terrisoli]|uniref:hypothetical protein n=1 Tax=Nocardioides terrisoli TaxID=3388267 RepID=UPI00287BC71A|nr:hypothetical protein [Nocardioides marmorisolisilvae]
MAKFHGSTNLNLGGPDPWAVAAWDDESQSYVIDVTGEDLKKFRAVAEDYGFAESGSKKADKDD